MPLLNITLMRDSTLDFKNILLERISVALIEAFDIKDNSVTAKINQYKKGEYLLSEDKDEIFLIVEVKCFPGRTIEQKKEFYELATKEISEVGLNKKHVIFLIEEVPLENWGIFGGQMASKFFGKN